MSAPVKLNHTHVSKALGDDAFFHTFPEYRTLEPKLAVGGTDDGCGGCTRAQRVQNLTADFIFITLALREDRLSSLKKHLGMAKMLVFAPHPRTGEWVNRII